MSRNCVYCSNILSNSNNRREPWDVILRETKSFVVTPTAGALIEGWVLIISKRHIPALGALTDTEFRELETVIAETRQVVESVYGPTILFEHGPACEGTTFGCGIDHAHLHIVPIDIPVKRILQTKLGTEVIWTEIQELKELSKIHKKGQHYLFVCDQTKTTSSVACLSHIPSQFMRQVIADYVGIRDQYDYHKHQFPSVAKATVNRLLANSTEATKELIRGVA